MVVEYFISNFLHFFFSAPSTQKRERDDADGPAAKVAKTENGS